MSAPETSPRTSPSPEEGRRAGRRAPARPPESEEGARSALLRRRLVLGGALVSLIGGGAALGYRYFSTRETSCDDWQVLFDGYGDATCQGGALRLAPNSATEDERTHAALAISTTAAVADRATQTITSMMTTEKQLREGTAPNPWEVAWLMWSFQDNEHFYALALKPNGWEVSKQDPAYPGNQRFLASAHEPSFEVGVAHLAQVRVDTTGDAVSFAVTADGQDLGVIEDADSPYRSGPVGAYTEDAIVTFAATTYSRN
ncbi:hypothetical protein CHIBA101_1003 [Actinomyces sp. Chiba101]|uniref:Uncharacterized protein n=1 Tax=Actinomyces denticolens TaxID=52767 RepID=A0ABY1ID92_9ACTO|nr:MULTISPECIES: hypothetical protein [Actinomyces]BAW92868.1 hypothetical protein CHIBA101_1003 [Actinomyces sp. Chiba101]GAV94157.1 hypothetical protein ADENT20671_0925 [Actinomyces denticolens]SHJ00182.1 hypothetical protein SAMN05216246_108101 [Actinomyces denticolens]SUU06539.1 Uncharacterised protein [Actinomyces denticolens]